MPQLLETSQLESLAKCNIIFQPHGFLVSGFSDAAGKVRSGVTRTDETTGEEIKAFTAQMAANDFRERTKAIGRFRDMANSNPTAICNNITKVLSFSTSTVPILHLCAISLRYYHLLLNGHLHCY